jgi:hypothetical protein
MANFLSYAQVRASRAESKFVAQFVKTRWTSVLSADRMRPLRYRREYHKLSNNL